MMMDLLAAPESGQVIFEYSIRRRILTWALLAPVVNGFYLLAVLMEPPNLRADLILLVIGLIPEYQLVLFWARPVRSARFYEDHAEFHGRNTNRTIGYSDIQAVKLRTGELKSPLTAIFLRAEPNPIALNGNPVSKDGKVRLYDWLQMKTQVPR
jgi:hypothetical protein